MNKRQFIVGLFFASLFGGLVAIGGFSLFVKNEPQQLQSNQSSQVKFTNYSLDTSSFTVPEGMNFIYAAEKSTPAVVHIRSTLKSSNQQSYNGPWDDMLRDFFDQNPERRRSPGMSSGSGVIISEDGYIVTNNHVIEGADEIEVTLNIRPNLSEKIQILIWQ